MNNAKQFQGITDFVSTDQSESSIAERQKSGQYRDSRLTALNKAYPACRAVYSLSESKFETHLSTINSTQS